MVITSLNNSVFLEHRIFREFCRYLTIKMEPLSLFLSSKTALFKMQTWIRPMLGLLNLLLNVARYSFLKDSVHFIKKDLVALDGILEVCILLRPIWLFFTFVWRRISLSIWFRKADVVVGLNMLRVMMVRLCLLAFPIFHLLSPQSLQQALVLVEK